MLCLLCGKKATNGVTSYARKKYEPVHDENDKIKISNP